MASHSVDQSINLTADPGDSISTNNQSGGDKEIILYKTYEEQREAYGREIKTRLQLQKTLEEQRLTHQQEMAAYSTLQTTHDELQTVVKHQQKLISMVKKLYKEQVTNATTDPITGLPNHRAFMNRMEDELQNCPVTQQICALLFVDIDHFKRINDTWGYQAGDVVLQEVGARLQTNIRQVDFIGRYEGDQFSVILSDIDINRAAQVAERLRFVIGEHPCTWESEETGEIVQIPVTISIGLAIYGLHGETSEALVVHTDSAMYRAKHTGRNRVCIADLYSDSDQENASSMQKKFIPEAIAIQALTAAANAHDQETRAHAQHMAELAQATARKLQRCEEEIYLIGLAATLHDIGKIGIPDAILHKPGPLNAEEWEIMRTHPTIGRQILQQLGGIFALTANVVVAHHECWDGSGYPHGLEKEAIPMNARILAVVDSYDAMTSLRPYRKPFSLAEAKAELQRCSGTQYDPIVVDAFLQFLDERETSETQQVDQELTGA